MKPLTLLTLIFLAGCVNDYRPPPHHSEYAPKRYIDPDPLCHLKLDDKPNFERDILRGGLLKSWIEASDVEIPYRQIQHQQVQQPQPTSLKVCKKP